MIKLTDNRTLALERLRRTTAHRAHRQRQEKLIILGCCCLLWASVILALWARVTR